jgi:hypothetical protein
VLDRYGLAASDEVIYPGIDLRRFSPRPFAAGASDTIGMVYRLESDKLSEAAIEPMIMAL